MSGDVRDDEGRPVVIARKRDHAGCGMSVVKGNPPPWAARERL
jgi:hypothetical protein